MKISLLRELIDIVRVLMDIVPEVLANQTLGNLRVLMDIVRELYPLVRVSFRESDWLKPQGLYPLVRVLCLLVREVMKSSRIKPSERDPRSARKSSDHPLRLEVTNADECYLGSEGLMG